MKTTITVSTLINAPISRVWSAWTRPEDITQWNAASDDWHSPAARNDLRVGGGFSYRMEARDKSAGFDFEGTYTEVIPHRRIAYTMGDERDVVVEFLPEGNSTRVTEIFAAESIHPIEMQRAGWQSILDRFRRHVEANVS